MTFASVDSCLRWAYGVLASPVTCTCHWDCTESPTRHDLSRYDIHAQAALIDALAVRSLVPTAYAYTRAVFGADLSQIPSLMQALGSDRRTLLRYCGLSVRGPPSAKARDINVKLDRMHNCVVAVLEPEFARRDLLTKP